MSCAEKADLWFIPAYIPAKKRKQVKPLEKAETKSKEEVVEEISADEQKECISVCREVSSWVIFVAAFAVCLYTWSACNVNQLPGNGSSPQFVPKNQSVVSKVTTLSQLEALCQSGTFGGSKHGWIGWFLLLLGVFGGGFMGAFAYWLVTLLLTIVLSLFDKSASICFGNISSSPWWEILYYINFSDKEWLRFNHVLMVWALLVSLFQSPLLSTTIENTLLSCIAICCARAINSTILAHATKTFHGSAYKQHLRDSLADEIFLVKLMEGVASQSPAETAETEPCQKCTNFMKRQARHVWDDILDKLLQNRRQHNLSIRQDSYDNLSDILNQIIELSAWHENRHKSGKAIFEDLLKLLDRYLENANSLEVTRIARHLRHDHVPIPITFPVRRRKNGVNYNSISSNDIAKIAALQLHKNAYHFSIDDPLMKILYHRTDIDMEQPEVNKLTSIGSSENPDGQSSGSRDIGVLVEVSCTQTTHEGLTAKAIADLFTEAFYKRSTVSKTLVESDAILKKLSAITGIFVGILTLFVIFFIFGLDFFAAVATIGSAILGLSFTFGSTLRNLFESTLLIFVARPFEVHDWVEIDGKLFNIVSIGLHNTQVLDGYTGYPTYLPTSTISRSTILNRTRGKLFYEPFVYICDLSTPIDVYKEINAAIKDLVKEYDDEFKNYTFFPTVRSDDPKKMNITVQIIYAHNCVDYNRKLYCRTLVSEVIRDVFYRHGVRATTETRLYNDQGGLSVVQPLSSGTESH
jgi:small-conductance mechanosensitive channel